MSRRIQDPDQREQDKVVRKERLRNRKRYKKDRDTFGPKKKYSRKKQPKVGF